MKETKVAIRYAKSILELALSQNVLEELNADMQLIASTYSENKELALLLKSPVVKGDKKQSILTAIFQTKVNALTMSAISLLITKKREYLLGEVAQQFDILYRSFKGIQRAEVTTAIALDEDLKKQIIAKMNFTGSVEFIEKVDPSLIGGFIVKVGDKQYDGSVATAIRNLRKNFTNNAFISALN